MAKTDKEKTIETYVEKLGISLAEAEELYNADREVDKMTSKEVNADLSTEQKKAVKKATNVGTKTVTTKKTPKPRAKDDNKSTLFAILQNALGESVQDLVVTTQDRQLDFSYNGKKFRVVLSAPTKA